MVIYIQFKLHENPLIVYLVMAEDANMLRFGQLKGINSSIADETLIKRLVQKYTIIIYI